MHDNTHEVNSRGAVKITRSFGDREEIIEFPSIVYRGQKVMTIDSIAQAFGEKRTNLESNKTNNSSRFREGVEVFSVKAEELRALKHILKNFEDVIPGRTARINLFTEKGVLAFAKMSNTDAAWEIHDKLVDAYFKLKEIEQQRPVAPISSSQMFVLQAQINLEIEQRLADQEAKIAEAEAEVKNVTGLLLKLDEKVDAVGHRNEIYRRPPAGTASATAIAERMAARYGFSQARAMDILHTFDDIRRAGYVEPENEDRRPYPLYWLRDASARFDAFVKASVRISAGADWFVHPDLDGKFKMRAAI